MEGIASAMRQSKKIKGIILEENVQKQTVFTDNKIVLIENSKKRGRGVRNNKYIQHAIRLQGNRNSIYIFIYNSKLLEIM